MRVPQIIVAAALLVGGATACSSDRAAPVGPEAAAPAFKRMKVQPPPGITGADDTVTVTHRAHAIEADVAREAVIGPEGGSLEIREAGMRLVVPRGAVAEPTTFTAVALSGLQVAYEFGPHGLRFPVPLVLEQDTRGLVVPDGEVPQAGYFGQRGDLLDDSTVGVFTEARRGRHDRVAATFSFDIEHFSGYAVATGRSE